MAQVVNARYCEGLSMSAAALFGSGPKFSITCGSCGCGFKARIQMVDYPVVKCPCGTPNRLNLVMS